MWCRLDDARQQRLSRVMRLQIVDDDLAHRGPRLVRSARDMRLEDDVVHNGTAMDEVLKILPTPAH